MKTIMTLALMALSTLSFANNDPNGDGIGTIDSFCEIGAYSIDVIEVLANAGHNADVKYEAAMNINNSCQFEAFQALAKAGMNNNLKYIYASYIKNPLQLEVFKCLAENDMVTDELYEQAYKVEKNCAAKIMCILANKKIDGELKYAIAHSCKE